MFSVFLNSIYQRLAEIEAENPPESGENPTGSTYQFPTTSLDLTEGADYGVVKVENGKLVIDVQDFNADFGNFD